MKENDFYTGVLEYKNINFAFVFDKKSLKLVSPPEKKDEVIHWFMKKIGDETYTLGEELYIDEVLCGITSETGHRIYLIPAYKSVSHNNFNLIIDIDYYILNRLDRKMIDRIAIKGPEINHIYPTTKALDQLKWEEDGQLLIKTKSFDETTTSKEAFNIMDNEISISFGISLSSSLKVGKSPMNLNSTMILDFKPTNDYKFIIRLVKIARQFIQFLCYRKNIVFSSIDLSAPTEKGLHERFATLYELKEENEIEKYPIEKDRLIKYEYLAGHIGKIFSDISNQRLYIGHIPESYEEGKHKTAASFVMITSAFEWEFKRNYPDGIKKSKRTIEVESKVTEIVGNFINESSGKEKGIWKYLKKHVADNSLQAEIIQYGKDYREVSDMFGNYLYALNNEVMSYNDLGDRISTQRNHFAHGDIDKEFIGLSLLDLVYLEYIIYIIQLKFYGVPDLMLKHAISDLFGCHLLIR